MTQLDKTTKSAHIFLDVSWSNPTTYLCLCIVEVSCLTVHNCENWHNKAKSNVCGYVVHFMISERWIQLLIIPAGVLEFPATTLLPFVC